MTPTIEGPSKSGISKPLNELRAYVAMYRKLEEKSAKRKVNLAKLQELQREIEDGLDRLNARKMKAAAKASQSNSKRHVQRTIEEYTEGKFILKGMDDVKEEFAVDELEYLEEEVSKIKAVRDLKFVHLAYLMKYKFYADLKAIEDGHVESEFHNRFIELKGEGKSINELRAEIRMTLFKNEQCEYINGFLQELFEANQKSEDGNIKHLKISYVATVMLYETVLKIVGCIHKITNTEELLSFLEKESREAYGISSDSEDEEKD